LVKEITDKTFSGFVKSNSVAVVDCWAAWCAPCRFLSPVIEKLAEEHGDIAFAKLDVDSNPATPMKFGIMSIPTLLYFKNGNFVDKTIGAVPKETIENVLKRLQTVG
jgi:thioredoxin 1